MAVSWEPSSKAAPVADCRKLQVWYESKRYAEIIKNDRVDKNGFKKDG